MFPLKDSHAPRKSPIITWIIIILNTIVFLLEMASPDPEGFIGAYALIPSLIDFQKTTTLTPFITSQFLHAGIIHILGNMWFLKVFGDSVEEKFGSITFLTVYLFSGVVGGLIQYLVLPNSSIPILGASGAVAGILGSYLVLFPREKIKTLIPVFGFFTIAEVPASFMLIYWFLIQFFSGVGSFAVAQVGGVAWWAHVGGFAAGWLIARLGPFLPENQQDFYEL